MKTILLTLATAAIATTFSSCGCCDNSDRPLEVRHYDSKGRLVKEIKPSGNFNTYHYDGGSPNELAPSYSATGGWKPRIP